jgi:acyl-CoA thioesterase I
MEHRKHLKYTIRLLALVGLLTCAQNTLVERPALADDAPATDVARWHLLEPFWTAPVVHGESVLFFQDDPAGEPNAGLLLKPEKILKVALANGSQTFEEGRDYVVKPGERKLTLPAGSRIGFLKPDQLYPPKGSPHSYEYKAGDPTRNMLFDNDHWFHDQQFEVTYTTSEPWQGYRPTQNSAALKKTLEKLRAHQPVTIAVSGDSISAGLNASGVTHAAPNQPAYPELVAQQLEATFATPIKLINRAVGGWRVENGLSDADKLLESKPDLVIVAYGMNHMGSRDPAAFRKLTAQLLERIDAVDPKPEVILVSPMWGNTNWVHAPKEMFPAHRDELAALAEEKQLGFADLTTLWGQMLERKRDIDLTGNGLNHPDDFGHRVYAEAVLGLLVDPPAKK